MSSDLTAIETFDQIKEALQDYISASYHISDSELVERRKALLEQEGVLYRDPFIESTRRYKTSSSFSSLNLPPEALALLEILATERADDDSPLAYDPPYTHQAAALEEVLAGKSLVVTTGTGSGKTEAFLYPVLSKLAMEAQLSPESFSKPAVRALVLYPMNALVNDQLGRLRMLVGGDAVAAAFTNWGGRPARFARYTSRTLYPGVRSSKKDSSKLASLNHFYVKLLEQARSHPWAAERIDELKRRGKWPAKPNITEWFGSGNWRQTGSGPFRRGITLPQDRELLTRHEVLEAPPDILVTNYSMLEYMLMRPLERPVFDLTRSWLGEHPNNSFLLIVDEAHLYRGAAGAEVALLLRRLRDRLGIPAERFQVICTSASFDDPNYARTFAAELTGKNPDDFAAALTGELEKRPASAIGTEEDARALAAVSVRSLYEANDDAGRLAVVQEFLAYRHVQPSEPVSAALHEALQDFPPLSLLVNMTMEEAIPLREIGSKIFEVADHELVDQAASSLIALASLARPLGSDSSLLPARVHGFYRGLVGLWACLNSQCDQGSTDNGSAPVGTLYHQPREECEHCGSRVLEFFTCRLCGAAYVRAYTDDLENPKYLFAEGGEELVTHAGFDEPLQPIDLLLEEPVEGQPVIKESLDLITGALAPRSLDNSRSVYRRDPNAPGRSGQQSGQQELSGEFFPCGSCGDGWRSSSSVQDHQTKGDEPFQALVRRQLEVQSPSKPPTRFAPLRGRKVLAFSDSRQTAARLAPNLEKYSTRDGFRPMTMRGWTSLLQVDGLSAHLNLEHLYAAILIGGAQLGVRLRPALAPGETFRMQERVEEALGSNVLRDPMGSLALLMQVAAENPPKALLKEAIPLLTNRQWGLDQLALASIRENDQHTDFITQLPDLGSIATNDTEKLELVRTWLGYWTRPGIWFQAMDIEWEGTMNGVDSHAGNFRDFNRWLAPEVRDSFKTDWLPQLLSRFCERRTDKKFRMLASELSLDLSPRWTICNSCRTVQQSVLGSTECLGCGTDAVVALDPDSDPVFSARKGFYRKPVVAALEDPPRPPVALIAREHTAQLNSPQQSSVFSKAEEYELLFQDVDLGELQNGSEAFAIDLLSSTTTMEVGIDIGTLSGVALRNLPPARSNYQQRAGRAGRRGTAVATVLAFGNAESHDDHYFTNPADMIKGPVIDPTLTLDNPSIARRHVTGYLLQRYHEERMPDIDPEEQPQLFAVLGSVEAFVSETQDLNRVDFQDWLETNEDRLREAVDSWLPIQLAGSDRTDLIRNLASGTLAEIDRAVPEFLDRQDDQTSDVESEGEDSTAGDGPDDESSEDVPTVDLEPEEPNAHDKNLLDRLLYKGALPRYAFPTDLAAFYVFDGDRYTDYQPEFLFAPTHGLSTALNQYAPGRRIWIDNREWESGALYSPMCDDLANAWAEKRLYFECETCGFATTDVPGARGDRVDCPACGTEDSLGPAMNWIVPPGFAHRHDLPPDTSPNDNPELSYATRAKLRAPSPPPAVWESVTGRIRSHFERDRLLVSNSGPRGDGYSLCTSCGLIEPTTLGSGNTAKPHKKPYPTRRHPTCTGYSTDGLVLGTDFFADILLVSLEVDAPVNLQARFLATKVALRTIADSLSLAGARMLDIDPTELQAEFRPAQSSKGRAGLEAEIYLYDTLAGGAGFAQSVGKLGVDLYETALKILSDCPGRCDRSCYRCLRSYQNKLDHMDLDRHLGASLLRYLLGNDPEPVLPTRRLASAARRLCADLAQTERVGASFEQDATVALPGIGDVKASILATLGDKKLIVGIHGPLTPGRTANPDLQKAMDYQADVPVMLVDEIRVSANLPAVTLEVLQRLEEL